MNRDEAGVEVALRSEKRTYRLRGNLLATRQRNVRTPRSEIRLDAGGQRGVRNSFVKLKEMGMSAPHADPNDLRPALHRKNPDAVQRQEKGGKLNRAKISAQFLLCLGRNITQKGQGEMNLIRGEPPDAGNVRIQPNEQLRDSVR